MNNRNTVGTIVTVLFVVAIVLLDNLLGLRIGKNITTFLSPIGIVVSDTGQRLGDFFGNITNIGSLQKENKKLNDQLDSALIEIARLGESKKENDSLRADLGFKKSTPLNLVPADVAYFDLGLTDGITVRPENMEGIRVGNVVLSQGYLIGRVSKIEGSTVSILLITDSASSIPSTLQNKTITGIAKGKIGNGLTMEQVPQNDNVLGGDVVVTSGLGGDLPKGLILGRVDAVQKISGSIFQSVVVRPAVDFTRIERVMIAR